MTTVPLSNNGLSSRKHVSTVSESLVGRPASLTSNTRTVPATLTENADSRFFGPAGSWMVYQVLEPPVAESPPRSPGRV